MFDNIQPIDLVAQRRRRRLISFAVFCVLMAGYLYYQFKNFPEERRVSQFFGALQHQEYQKAYELWQPAPSYTFKDFNQDWGPNGLEWPVNQFHITGSTERGSGVIVRVQINSKENVALWVEKKNKSLGFPP